MSDLAVQAEPDLRRTIDLMPPPDLGGICAGKEGSRTCALSSMEAGACSKEGIYLPDRRCTGDGCADGHCRKPVNARKCLVDIDCSSGGSDMGQEVVTCQPFTTLFNTYDLYCARAPGAAQLFAACESDGECQSNVCYPFQNDRLRCTKPCQKTLDCEGRGVCGPLDPMIEGFRVNTNFCVPS